MPPASYPQSDSDEMHAYGIPIPASARHLMEQPSRPILRVWGHVWRQDNSAPNHRTRHEISICGDEIVTLKRLPFPVSQLYRDGQAESRLQTEDHNMDLDEVKKYTTIRRDKWSSTHDWEPGTVIAEIEVEAGRWEQVQVVLWDKSWMLQTSLAIEIRVTLQEVVKAVQAYFRNKSSATFFDGVSTNSAPSIPKLLKGRRRRQARRHHVISPGSGNIQVARQESGAGFILRGRWKRRQRRKNFNNESPKTELEFPPEKRTMENQFNSSLPPPLHPSDLPEPPYWAENICQLLIEPETHAQGSLIAVPIMEAHSRRGLGCLMVPREQFFRDQIAGSGGSNDLETVVTIAINNTCFVEDSSAPPNGEYWSKFPVGLRTEYANELASDMLLSLSVIPDIEISLTCSYYQSPLVFPDQTEVAPSEKQYLMTFAFLPNDDGHANFHSPFSGFVRWMSDIGQMWHTRRLDPYVEEDNFPIALGSGDESTDDLVLSARSPDFSYAERSHDIFKEVTHYAMAISSLENEYGEPRYQNRQRYPEPGFTDETHIYGHHSPEAPVGEVTVGRKAWSRECITRRYSAPENPGMGSFINFHWNYVDTEEISETSRFGISGEETSEEESQSRKISEDTSEVKEDHGGHDSFSDDPENSVLHDQSPETRSGTHSELHEGRHCDATLEELSFEDFSETGDSKTDSTKEAERRMIQTIYDRYSPLKSRDILVGSRVHEHVPFCQQELVFRRAQMIAQSNKQHASVVAHAQFQVSIHLLSGFGTEQDVAKGLCWVRQASKGGSHVARALVKRFYVAYGYPFQEESICTKWLAKEAALGSFWALDELRRSNEAIYNSVRGHYFIRTDQGYEQDDDSRHPRLKTLKRWMMMRKPNELTQRLQKMDDEKGKHIMPTPMITHFLALRWSCAFESLEKVKALLETNSLMSIDPRFYMNLLRVALGCGRVRVAQTILVRIREAISNGSLRLEQNLASYDRFLFDPNAQILREVGLQPFPGNPFLFLGHFPESLIDEIVRDLVASGFDVNHKENVRTTRVDGFELLLEPDSGKTPNKTFSAHWAAELIGESITPLRYALIHGNFALVKALVSHGAEFPVLPDSKSYARVWPRPYPPSAPTVAILDEPCYDIDILRLFLDRHGTQKGHAPFAETPLGLIVMELDSPARRLRYRDACLSPNLFPILSLLRRYQPGCDAQLFWAAVKNNHIDIVRYLLEHGVSIELRYEGMTPLHTSILHGRIDIFNELLENGADPFAVTTTRGVSPIHLVLWNQKALRTEMAMINALHRIHGNIDGLGGDFGRHVHPIHLAVLNCRPETVRLLLELGADRGAVLKEDIMTTLHRVQFSKWGVENSHRLPEDKYEGMRFPPATRQSINLTGYTPLGIVLARIDMFLPRDAIKMLWLLLGTNPASISAYYTRPAIKQTILHLLACTPTLTTGGLCGEQPIMQTGLFEQILEHGAKTGLNINIRDIHGDTPLHYASLMHASRDLKMMDLLLRLGADVRVLNSHEMSPMALRARGLASLSSPPGKLEEAETRLTLQSIPIRSDFVDESLHEAEGRKSPWFRFQSGLGLPSEDNLGRVWERLSGGCDVVMVWDMEQQRWVELPSPIHLRMCTSEDNIRKGFVHNTGHLIIRPPGRGISLGIEDSASDV